MNNYLQFLSAWRAWIIVSIFFLTAGLAMGAGFLKVTTDYRVFFSPDDPLLKALNRLHDTYAKDDNVLFVITPKDGKVFSRDTLGDIAWLTEQAWQVPYVQRVDSLQNFQYTYADGDELVVRDLYRQPETLSSEELERIKAIAVNEPLLRNRLISPGANVTGVNLSVVLPGVDESREVPRVVAHARRLARELVRRDGNLQVRLTGGLVMSNAFPEASQHDMRTLVPSMFVIVFLALWLLLRSMAAVLWSLLTILFAIVSTMGLAGWLGFTLSPPSAAAPNIILTVAVADCVHVLASFLLLTRKAWLSADDLQQIRFKATGVSMRRNLSPVFLTSLTTALGFLTLNFSDSPPFRDLGNITAIGVFFAFFYTVTLLPALMMAMPFTPHSRGNSSHKAMLGLGPVVIRWRWGLMAGVGLLALGLASQAPRNELNDDLLEYFSEDTSFRRDTEYAISHLTGIYMLEYDFPAGRAGGIAEPGYLRVLDDFAQWFLGQPEVLHVQQIADILKRLNRNMHGDDPAWYRLPETRELAAQYLLLYEMSLPEGLELTDRINVDKSASRFTVTLGDLSSNEIIALERRARRWLWRHAPSSMRVEATGPNLIMAHIGRSNIDSMVLGTGVAFCVIALVLVVVLQSPAIGLLSLLPNAIPALMAFGLWALINGKVNMGLSVVAGMTMGIVVDDTVHFLTKWMQARRRGKSGAEAVCHAFEHVGTAMWVTSVVLAAGFAILSLSDFEVNAQMGKMTAMIILFALIADFLLLPPLLLLGAGRCAKEPVSGKQAETHVL